MNYRIRAWYVLGCVAVIATIGCRRQADPTQHLKRGAQHLQQQQFSAAIIELRLALQIDPRLGEARLKLGDAYALSGSSVDALREYVRAADLLPNRPDAQLKAGN